MPHFRTSSYTKREFYRGKHRFEHWYRDNTVYFITARTRDGYHAFISPRAKEIFWNRFTHYSEKYGFVPWVSSLLSNHYHIIGYLKIGANLGPFMQHLHGSVSKLCNDILPERRVPFFRIEGNKDYFDGCIRDEKQARRAYRYTLTQAGRHRLGCLVGDDSITRINIDIDRALKRAKQLKAYLTQIPYPRYKRI